MSKIRVLSDHIANQIAAGEVVERPASVAKELVENSIDAGARRLEIDVEAGGRRLLRVSDDGEGMTRDDAVLAFERHATSKISKTEDLSHISTLGFRGEALASIASVARVELVTQMEGATEATRVLIEGGRMRDVGPAARPRGTTIAVRDLFFNIPARRKFLRSEATESFHLTNLITHYALAHPEIAFVLTNNGRETLRASPAATLGERAYQIFGAEFLENLLEISGVGHELIARVSGYVSAPRERRSTRDAQYLFVNGRFVRDRLVARALSEGYRSVLPQGVYPAALLFLEVPLEEVDVNVHPAKTEVRFRRAPAVADAVREAVRAALTTGGFLRPTESPEETESAPSVLSSSVTIGDTIAREVSPPVVEEEKATRPRGGVRSEPQQEAIEFGRTPPPPATRLTHESEAVLSETVAPSPSPHTTASVEASRAVTQDAPRATSTGELEAAAVLSEPRLDRRESPDVSAAASVQATQASSSSLPPLHSVAGLMREVASETLPSNIRALGQFGDSFIIASDAEGLLLIDQHLAHERILFEKYRVLEDSRRSESQQLLVPETFDLTPAQAAAFDDLAPELELYGFELMRLSGRTVAIKCVPSDLPASEARNMLAEILDTVDAERRGAARESMRERVAAALAGRAAIKINTALTQEKMRWLIDRLRLTSSPTTCPHGRPIIMRLSKRDIERGFQRS